MRTFSHVMLNDQLDIAEIMIAMDDLLTRTVTKTVAIRLFLFASITGRCAFETSVKIALFLRRGFLVIFALGVFVLVLL